MTSESGKHTYREIQSQPEVWAESLDTFRSQIKSIQTFIRNNPVDTVLFTGCGSTYYLAIAAASVFQELTGIPSRGLPASEIWLYPRGCVPTGRTLLVAVSRSGETTETIHACEAFHRNHSGKVITLTCYPGMPLPEIGDLNLLYPAAQEISMAQTRAFSTLYLMTVAFSAVWAGKEDLLDELAKLPAAGRHLLNDQMTLPEGYGRNHAIDRFYFLGSGSHYGLACELSLKMKEMSLSHSEPFHFMEFRHGPKSMVGANALVFGLVSSENKVAEQAVLDDMRRLNGNVLGIAEEGQDITFNSGAAELMRSVLYLPVGQIMAYERSISKGLNPDLPANLTTVVKLDASGASVA
jgi:glucosamine--fructose-6-phosphate aminotransferase (isomerizing)